MKIEILGTGGAYSPELGNTSFLIWDGKESSAILMDCGYTVFPTLLALERKTGRKIISKIKTIFISHMHADHAGSLGTLLQYIYYTQKRSVKIAGAPIKSFLRQVIPCEYNKVIHETDKSIKLLSTEHDAKMLSYGAYVNGVLYSGDSKNSLLNTTEAKKALIILHEVALPPKHVHTLLDELAAANPSLRAKTWLTHYSSSDSQYLRKAVQKHGFGGLLRKGQILQRD